jgi:hypothetical protein
VSTTALAFVASQFPNPRVNNISVFNGGTINLIFTMSPVTDITGWTIVFTMRGLLATTLVLSIAATLTTAGSGIFTVPFTRTQSLLLRGEYEYDIWRTNSGHETPLSLGAIIFAPSVLNQ